MPCDLPSRLPWLAFTSGAGTRRTTDAVATGRRGGQSRPDAEPRQIRTLRPVRRLPAGRQRGGSSNDHSELEESRHVLSLPFAAVGSANGAVPCLIWAALTDLDGVVLPPSRGLEIAAMLTCRGRVCVTNGTSRHSRRATRVTRRAKATAGPGTAIKRGGECCLRAGPAVPKASGNVSAMDISPSGNAPGSRVNRQAQDVAPAPRFACHDPVTSAQIRAPHPADAIALSDTQASRRSIRRDLRSIRTPSRSIVTLCAVAVDMTGVPVSPRQSAATANVSRRVFFMAASHLSRARGDAIVGGRLIAPGTYGPMLHCRHNLFSCEIFAIASRERSRP